VGTDSAGTGASIIRWDGAQWSVDLDLADGALADVQMVSPTDGWAVGSWMDGSGSGLLVHWDGTAWHPESTRTHQHLQAVDMVAADDGWAVGYSGAILHWDGTSWRQQPTPVAGWLHDVAMVGPEDGWIAGDRVYGGGFWLRYAPGSDVISAFLPALLRGPWPAP